MAIVTEQAALPSTTAQNLIKRAYKILGDVDWQEPLDSSQATDGLEALNTMLDAFSTEGLMIYQIRQEQQTWPANTTSRTIGPSGDFASHRPLKIEEGTYFQDSNSIAYPVEIARSRSTYDNIYDKTVQSSYPRLIYLDTSVSEATIYVYPVPNQSLTLFLNTWQPLTVFDTLTETFVLPPGYRRMIAFNLARELAPEVGLPMPMDAMRMAAESKSQIKRINHRPIYGATETAYALNGMGRSDIVAGK